jgi:hypothetical protein
MIYQSSHSQLKRLAACALLLTLSAFEPTIASDPSPSGGAYVIRKQVVAGGGAKISEGPFVLTGTIAQNTSHIAQASTTRVYSGFHAPLITESSDILFRNSFESSEITP